jgi:CheY-like chemotaxis protein
MQTRLRVLVVDDNVDTARTLAVTLQLMGYDTRTAFDGEEALAAAARFRPDRVLLDIGLPGVDGFEVVRRMRKMPELAGTRVAAVTGYSASEDRQRGKEAGFDEYFVKPVAHDAIVRFVAD